MTKEINLDLSVPLKWLSKYFQSFKFLTEMNYIANGPMLVNMH